MCNIPLAKIIRSGYVEAVHNGSIVVMQNNEVIFSVGDINQIVSLRSTAKPFLLLPLIQNGGVNKFHLSDSDLTIMASSHNGEKAHRDTISNILDRVQLKIEHLHCGTHLPYFEWLIPEYIRETEMNLKQLYHNCSGKHTAMLLMCKLLDYPIANYWELDHLLQQTILKKFQSFLEYEESEEIARGLDGCGAPNYFLPLERLAFAYQKLSSDKELAIVRESIIQQPFMLAGTDRLDSLIIEKCKYIAKSGSEGLFCVSIPAENIGIALKIEGGCDDAAESCIVRLLNKMGFITKDMMQYFSKYQNIPIYTSTNIQSGQYEPCF